MIHPFFPGSVIVYPRHKQCLISDRLTPPNRPLSFSWEWRHPPRGKETSKFDELTAILEKLPPFQNHPDKWTWSAPTTSGVFQVREMSVYLDSIWTSTSAISMFWCKLLSRKINLFLSRTRSFLPCLLQLAIKGISVPSIYCPLCGVAAEDIDHALFRCLLPRRVWEAVGQWWGVGSSPLLDCDELFSETVLNLVPATARPLWVEVLFVAA